MNAKKFLTTFLALILVFAMVGCGSNSNTNTENQNETNGEETTIEFPTKNLTISVPYAAGGAADVISRKVASFGEESFGQPVVVENLTGAGGTICATDYLKEAANTHKFMLASRSIFVTIPLVQDVQYSYEEFEPVIGIENVEFILFINPETTGANTLEELIEFGKENTINYGTAGSGTDLDLIQSGLFAMADVNAEAVVYGGAKEALNNVASGVIDVTAAPPAAAMGLMGEGSIIPVATVADDAFEGFDGYVVPSLIEQGYDIDYEGLNFFVIRKGTDPAVIDFLYQTIADIYATDDYQEFANNLGIDQAPLSPEEIDDYIAAQQATAQRLYDLINE